MKPETTGLSRAEIMAIRKAPSYNKPNLHDLRTLCDMAIAYLDLRDGVMKDAAHRKGIQWP